MNQPFAYVIYLEHDEVEPWVSLCQTLEQVEAALRTFVARVIVGPCTDGEIVSTLAECGEHVRVFALYVEHGSHSGSQFSVELKPFARSAEAA